MERGVPVIRNCMEEDRKALKGSPFEDLAAPLR